MMKKTAALAGSLILAGALAFSAPAGETKPAFSLDTLFSWLEGMADDSRVNADTGTEETESEDTASAGEGGESQDVQYVLYVGTNDKDTNEPVCSHEEAMETAKEILIDHFGGYTIDDAQGGWVNDDGMRYEEYTLMIYLSDTTIEDVHAAATDLQEAFNQSTILIQENLTRTEFFSG